MRDLTWCIVILLLYFECCLLVLVLVLLRRGAWWRLSLWRSRSLCSAWGSLRRVMRGADQPHANRIRLARQHSPAWQPVVSNAAWIDPPQISNSVAQNTFYPQEAQILLRCKGIVYTSTHPWFWVQQLANMAERGRLRAAGLLPVQ